MERHKINQQITRLEALAEQRSQLRTLIQERTKDLTEALEEVEVQMTDLREELKPVLREAGPGTYGSVRVKSPPKKTVINTEGLINKAIEEGDLPALIDHQAVYYTVKNPDVIRRLTGVLGARYKQFITVEEGTAGVTFPAHLK